MIKALAVWAALVGVGYGAGLIWLNAPLVSRLGRPAPATVICWLPDGEVMALKADQAWWDGPILKALDANGAAIQTSAPCILTRP